MNIQTLADLQNHVQWAIEIEHATIPPYLCAFYSLQDTSSNAAGIIQDVVVEEMLHLALACNLLSAIGGSPTFNNPSFIPTYPSSLPHHVPDPPLIIHLQKCSVDLINNIFLAIEKPETVGDIPESDNYTTLGQFYAALSNGFTNLNQSLGQTGLFKGNSTKQVTGIYTSTSELVRGHLVKVVDLDSAQQALLEIVQQGEGSSQTEKDPDGNLAHYWAFNQIVDGTAPLGQVYPMIQDPTTASLPPGSSLQKLSQLFNDCYSLLLRTMTHIFSVGDSSSLVTSMYGLMRDILPTVAGLLVQTPIPNKNANAGPSFEFSTTLQKQIILNSKALESVFPQLGDVTVSLKALGQIDGS